MDMNINELFEEIQDKFSPEDLNGELELHGNCIVWTYVLSNDAEEIPVLNDDDEEQIYSFECSSTEELLQEAYDEDVQLIKEFLDKIEEIDNWSFSDADTIDDTISFKIF